MKSMQMSLHPEERGDGTGRDGRGDRDKSTKQKGHASAQPPVEKEFRKANGSLKHATFRFGLIGEKGTAWRRVEVESG